MKKTLLLVVVVMASFLTAFSQILTIAPDYASLSFPASEFSDAAAYMQNNSSVERTIKWVRYVDVEPAGWYTTVCDDKNCYAPSTSTNTLPIAANAQGLLKLNVFANDVIGTGSYHIIAYDVNDSANANVTLTVDVVTNPAGISDVNTEVVSIYPNPAKDVLYMNLDASKKINSIDIHNVVGQKIKTVNLQDGVKSVAIPVSDLKKGIYFVRIFSNGKEVATKTFSKD